MQTKIPLNPTIIIDHNHLHKAKEVTTTATNSANLDVFLLLDLFRMTTIFTPQLPLREGAPPFNTCEIQIAKSDGAAEGGILHLLRKQATYQLPLEGSEKEISSAIEQKTSIIEVIEINYESVGLARELPYVSGRTIKFEFDLKMNINTRITENGGATSDHLERRFLFEIMSCLEKQLPRTAVRNRLIRPNKYSHLKQEKHPPLRPIETAPIKPKNFAAHGKMARGTNIENKYTKRKIDEQFSNVIFLDKYRKNTPLAPPSTEKDAGMQPLEKNAESFDLSEELEKIKERFNSDPLTRLFVGKKCTSTSIG